MEYAKTNHKNSQKLISLSKQIISILEKEPNIKGTSLIKEMVTDEQIQDRVFKNTQRRMYDTLNVLSALNIIKKIRNHIQYIGRPTSSSILASQIVSLKCSVQEKMSLAKRLFWQFSGLKKLVDHKNLGEEQGIHFPFVIIKGSQVNVIEAMEFAIFASTDPIDTFRDEQVLLKLGKTESLPTDLSSEIQ